MITPTNSHFAQHWHLKVIEAEEAWQLLRTASGVPVGNGADLTFGSAGINIAVLDEGLATQGGVIQHPAFTSNLSNGNSKGAAFYDWKNDNAGTWEDENNDLTEGNHGLQCAGIAAGNAEYNSPAYNGNTIVGVAPNCPLIGILSANTVQGQIRQFYWLAAQDMAIYSRLFESPRIPATDHNLGFFLPAGQTTDVLNLSLAFAPGDAERLERLQKAGYIMTVFGRNGRGIFVAASSGNDNEETSQNQILSQLPRYNLIGATGLRNSASSGYYIQDELRASYSNFGKELSLSAPGGDSSTGQDRHMIYTSTKNFSGDFHDTPLLSLTLNNASKDATFNNHVKIECTNTGGAKGLYVGQYIAFGNPSVSKDFETQVITKVNVGTNHIWVRKIQSRALNTINNLAAKVAPFYTTAKTGGAHTTTEVFVDSIDGFKDNQKIFIGNPASGGLERTVSGFGASSIQFTPALGAAPADGTWLIAGDISATTTANVPKPAADDEYYMWLPLDSVQGLKTGMRIIVQGSWGKPDPYNPTNFIDQGFSMVTGIHEIAGSTISIKIPGGTWNRIATGATVSTAGFGNFDTDFAGTSAAAPVASGVAALMLSANPDLSWLEVKEILKDTADKIDLTQTSATGKWKDADGKPVFSGNSPKMVEVITGKTVAIQANQGEDQLTLNPDSSGIKVGTVLKIHTPFKKDYVVVTELLVGDTVQLDRKLTHTYGIGKKVTVGREAVFSEYYGYGRVNAKRAVEAAGAYSDTDRDLYIRDSLTDTGAASGTAAGIDSPDIWVRNIPPSLDGADAIDTYGVAPPHRNPNKNQNKWVYVRVKNRGTQYKSLEGTQLRVAVLFTDDNTSPISLPYPDVWLQEEKFELSGKNYEVKFLTPEFDKEFAPNYLDSSASPMDQLLQENPNVSQTDWEKPHLLAPIDPSTDYTAIIPWPESVFPSDPSLDQMYILAQLTPFDGPVFGSEVHENTNLSYRKVVYAEATLKDSSGGASFGHDIEVDTSGSTETKNFKLDVSQIKPTSVDGIEITAVLSYSDGITPDETVVYKKTGSWGFTPSAPSWMSLTAPVLSGATTPYQELTRFSGTFTVNNTYDKIELNVLVKDGTETIIDRDIPVFINPNPPANPDGVGRQQKVVLDTFTEFDNLPYQSASQKFGPISGAPKFRTAALFNDASAPPASRKAYAVTDGVFFIQRVTGQPIVNLILKPDAQPWNAYGRVKYYVYRGIKKESFLDGSDEPHPQVNATNDLLNEMWVRKNKYNADKLLVDPGHIAEVIKRSDLGLTETGSPIIPDDTPIGKIFDDYDFQKVKKGWHIGDFDHTGTHDYGFEVIVEGPGKEPTLKTLRVLDHQLEITYAAGQPQHPAVEEDIKSKIEREQCLNYLDPAAYFGLMVDQKINVRETTGNTVYSTVADVANNVVSKFGTQNRIYLDIRNDMNTSLNLFGQYGDGSTVNPAIVKFKDSANNMVDEFYPEDGWPIVIIDTNDLAGTISGKMPLELQLPIGDNGNPCLYLSGTRLHSDFPDDSLKFSFLTPGVTHTNSFELGLSAFYGAVCSAHKFQIGRRYNLATLVTAIFPGPTIEKQDLFDLLYTPRDISLTPLAGSVLFDSKEDPRYNGWTTFDGIDFTLRSGKASDDIGEILYAVVDGKPEVAGGTGKGVVQSAPILTKGKETAGAFYEMLFKKKLANAEMIDLDTGSTVSIPRINSYEDNLSGDITKESANNMFSLAYTTAQKGTIQTAIAGLYDQAPVYYVALNHTLETDNNDVPYFEMQLGVQGVDYDNVNFTHVIDQVNTGITFYSFDGRHYFTEDYATGLAPLLPFE